MKTWMVGGLLVLMTAAGCAKGGSGTEESAQTGGDSKSDTCPAGTTLAEQDDWQTNVLPNDPFETFGKLLLDGSASNGTYADADETVLPAGTELTVQLIETCVAAGEITSAIRAGDSAPAQQEIVATPSGVRDYTWILPSDTTRLHLRDLANADSCVKGVSSSSTAEIDAFESEPEALPNDPLAAEQGHLKMLELSDGLNPLKLSAESATVTIAVIDTGIDDAHEDLKDVIWVNSKEIPGNKKDDDHNGYVDDATGYNFEDDRPSPRYSKVWSAYHHGTHVAGLAAAKSGNGIGVAGIMGAGARIMALNVFGGDSGAKSSNVTNAIRYAADNGADVINLSLGGPGRNSAYESAISYAVKKGVTVFAAAGNQHEKLGPSYFHVPAGYGAEIQGMLTIGSVDSSDTDWSRYSNYSPTYVELAAPGSEISTSRKGLYSTMPGDKYARIQGTSMASPVAAGGGALAIAMLRARGYNPSPATIEKLMKSSARKKAALANNVQSGQVMNLRTMAEFINANYPDHKGEVPVDPGVPEKVCL